MYNLRLINDSSISTVLTKKIYEVSWSNRLPEFWLRPINILSSISWTGNIFVLNNRVRQSWVPLLINDGMISKSS